MQLSKLYAILMYQDASTFKISEKSSVTRRVAASENNKTNFCFQDSLLRKTAPLPVIIGQVFSQNSQSVIYRNAKKNSDSQRKLTKPCDP